MKIGLVLVYLAAFVAVAQTEPERLISLELTGGAFAGHYEVQDRGSCSYDPSWTINYLGYLDNPAELDPEALGSLTLSVPDETTSAFTLVAGFNDFAPLEATDLTTLMNTELEHTEYIIDTVNGIGTGSVEIEKNGKHALLTVTGETAEGVALTATFECLDVSDFTGEMSAVNESVISFPPDAISPTGSLELTISEQHYSVQTGTEVVCNPSWVGDLDFWYEYNPGGSYTGIMVVILSLEEAQLGTAGAFRFLIDSQDIAEDGNVDNFTVSQDGNIFTLNAELTSAEGTVIATTITCSLTD